MAFGDAASGRFLFRPLVSWRHGRWLGGAVRASVSDPDGWLNAVVVSRRNTLCVHLFARRSPVQLWVGVVLAVGIVVSAVMGFSDAGVRHAATSCSGYGFQSGFGYGYGYDPQFGYGCPTGTAPPSSVLAAAGDGGALVRWNPPAFVGGTGLARYELRSNPATTTVIVAASTTVASVAGLANGTAYTFTVSAVTTTGAPSVSSPSNRVVPGVRG